MSESDPVEEFEKKLKKMTLKELQAYGKLLDEKIKQRISANESTKKIAALIFTGAYLITRLNQELLRRKSSLVFVGCNRNTDYTYRKQFHKPYPCTHKE